MKNDIPFFLFQNVVFFKYVICFLLICSNNRRRYDNVFAIQVKFSYGFLDIYEFLKYKIFCFIWTIVGTDMDDDIIQLFLKIRN